MDPVKQGSTAYLSLVFRDKLGEPAAPTTATWEVHDKASGTTLLPVTALTPAASVEITIPATVNRLLVAGHQHEIRVVTVKASYGADDAINSHFEYTVQRVPFV